MPPLLAFNVDLFRDVLRAFDNLDKRARCEADDFLRIIPETSTPTPAMSQIGLMIIAWRGGNNGFSPSVDGQSAGCGLDHLIEQQLGALSLDCGYERVRDTNLDIVKTWYTTNLGIDLSSLEPWAKIHELRLVANSVKHAEGGSAKQLRDLRPDLFQNPAFAHIRAEMGASWFDRREQLAMPLAGEDLFLTEDDLRNYSAAAVALFEGIVEFCEARAGRFPLNR